MVTRVLQDQLDLPEYLVLQVRLVLRAKLVKKVRLDLQALKENKDPWARLDLKDPKEILVYQEHREMPEAKEI